MKSHDFQCQEDSKDIEIVVTAGLGLLPYFSDTRGRLGLE
jgi:hypothetical protein